MKTKSLVVAFVLLLCGSLQAQNYHEDDKDGLRVFLRQQTDKPGKLNLDRLGLTTADTLNWSASEAWVAKLEKYCTWNKTSPQRLTKLNVENFDSDNKLYGRLDTSKFILLEELNCFMNQLTSLDVSKNIRLEYLNCISSGLTSLDVSNNLKLKELACSSNQLSSLDVSKNVKLEYLNCVSVGLTSLDVSKNIGLIRLDCSKNKLISLNVLEAVNLKELNCYNNQLSILNISKNVNLEYVDCENNQLESLDVSKNVKLEYLDYSDNQLIVLDVSKNVKLEHLECYSNRLLFSALVTIENSYFQYSPQKRIEGGFISAGNVIDLSSEYLIKDNITVYEWYTESRMPVKLSQVANGKFTAEKAYDGTTLICNMSNAAYPRLTIEYRLTIIDN